MKPGSVLVDVCIDQGGVAETSRPTSIADPTFVEEGIVHYCVPNMPALVPRTSTQALTQAVFPWVEELANDGVEQSLKTNPAIRASLLAHNGGLTNSVVAKALAMPFTEPKL
jgi:alanine dehydrogenase